MCVYTHEYTDWGGEGWTEGAEKVGEDTLGGQKVHSSFPQGVMGRTPVKFLANPIHLLQSMIVTTVYKLH